MGSTGTTGLSGADELKKDRDNNITFKFIGINNNTGQRVEGVEIKAPDLATANAKAREKGYTIVKNTLLPAQIYDNVMSKKTEGKAAESRWKRASHDADILYERDRKKKK